MSPSNDNGAGDSTSPAAKAAEYLVAATRCLQAVAENPDAAQGLLKAAALYADRAHGWLNAARVLPGRQR
jgi:hypothetical protein